MQRTCERCGKTATNPQAFERLENIPLKRHGWVGTTFVPFERKYKKFGRIRKEWLCGLCASLRHLDEEKEKGGITEMEYSELRQELLALASKEVAVSVRSTSGHNGNGRVQSNRSNGKVAHGKTKIKRSPEDARFFGHFSVQNAVIIESSFPCGCKAYEDCYTFGRWLAQGMAVQKGQHGVKIPVYFHSEQKDPETGEVREVVQRRGTAAVFCKHQVAPVKVSA